MGVWHSRAACSAALAAALPAPRCVVATPERCVIAAGVAERRSAPGFDVVDEPWRDGRLWLLRAPFDAATAWPGAAAIEVWRPREAYIVDDHGVFHVDDAGRVTDAGARGGMHDGGSRTLGRLASAASAEEALAVRVEDEQDRAAYQAAVQLALGHIAAGTVSKLVIARRARLVLPSLPRFAALVQALLEDFVGSTVYAREWDEGRACFFGASPEQLLRRSGEHVEVDAVAGTRRVAEAQALLVSEKDRREQHHVVQGVVAALAGAGASSPSVSAVHVVDRGGLSHLACTVSARTQAPLSALLEALHPTAATAGTPRRQAVALLSSIERLARGDYGGLIGVIDRGSTVVAVALRAAHVTLTEAFVFAGAGIVAGSDPASEWRETALKARVLIPAIARALRS